MQLGEEVMEMQALFLVDGQGTEEAVQQPALAPPHGAMQVQARRLRGGLLQGVGQLPHALDHLQLAMAQGVAQVQGLMAKVVMDQRASGARAAGGPGEQATPGRSSLCRFWR